MCVMKLKNIKFVIWFFYINIKKYVVVFIVIYIVVEFI